VRKVVRSASSRYPSSIVLRTCGQPAGFNQVLARLYWRGSRWRWVSGLWGYYSRALQRARFISNSPSLFSPLPDETMRRKIMEIISFLILCPGYVIATYSLPLLNCKHRTALARGKVSSTPQTTRSRLSPQATVNKSKLTPSSCPVRIAGSSHPGPAPLLPKE
jgi:hypothetical protein